MPTVALIAIVLLGIAALGTDVFLMYWNQQNLQSASDAAALAGATYLSDTTFSGANAACTYATPAQQAACTYALANGVLASEIQSITVVSDGICATPPACTITIVISRTIAATFARLLGFTQFTLKAQAVADLVGVGQTYNMIPVGVDATTPYTYGQPIVMHNGNCGPGCWGGVDYAGSGSSGAALRTELDQGCGCNVVAGNTYNSIPGNKVGPVTQGVGDRITAGNTADPSGTWQSHALTNTRVTTVGLVTWGNGGGANQTATVTGFAEVWLTDSNQSDFPAACQGMGNGDICGIFIRQVVPSTSGTQGTNSGALRAVLLQ